MIAAQLWDLARTELPDLDEQLADGDLEPLAAYLGERIYRLGGKLEPAELIVRVAGGPLDPEPLLRQLRQKFSEIYRLD